MYMLCLSFCVCVCVHGILALQIPRQHVEHKYTPWLSCIIKCSIGIDNACENNIGFPTIKTVAYKEQDNEMSAKIVKENHAKIKGSYATLVRKVRSKLGGKDIDMKDFRLYILNLFPPGDLIADTISVADIFEAVSRHQLWDYSYCTPIEEIAKEFGGDDLELRRWIDDYKSELAGFKATTKIVDYIKVCNDEEKIADSHQSLRKDIARCEAKVTCHREVSGLH